LPPLPTALAVDHVSSLTPLSGSNSHHRKSVFVGQRGKTHRWKVEM